MDMSVTWGDRIRTAGAAIGIATFLGASFAAAIDKIPYAKKSEMEYLRAQVAAVAISQKESQELQLMERIDAIGDRLKRMSPDTQDYAEFRSQRVSAQQRLVQVQSDLVRARNGQ